MTHDDRAAQAAVPSYDVSVDGVDPLDEALRKLGQEILDEPLPEGLLALLDSIPDVKRA